MKQLRKQQLGSARRNWGTNNKSQTGSHIKFSFQIKEDWNQQVIV
jgi:hypothetical protein